MKRLLPVAGALMALLSMAAPSPAAAQQLASADPLAVQAGTYKIEPYHTQVGFSISHFGFSNLPLVGDAVTLKIASAFTLQQ